jgi:hypothetical protein
MTQEADVTAIPLQAGVIFAIGCAIFAGLGNIAIKYGGTV